MGTLSARMGSNLRNEPRFFIMARYQKQALLLTQTKMKMLLFLNKCPI